MLRKFLNASTRYNGIRAAQSSLASRSYSKPQGEIVIGVDLGTTNSCVAIVEDGTPKVIENSEGGRTTPSIVAFDNKGQRLVGQPARRQAVTNSRNTFFSTKRLIGRRYEDKITQSHKQSVPYNVVAGPNGDAWVEAHGKKYSPSQVGAFILTKMKETAEAYVGREVKHAVVTVPAYFDDSQRQATKDAGTIAGLVVHRIINEPTAAALAYGLDKTDGQTIAVFDLGGGTFDISILEISGGVFEVKATNGDTFLGGEDFDHQISSSIIEDFKRAEGVDLSNDRMAVSRIKEAAEKAKKELDHMPSVEINLPFITQSADGVKHLVTNISKQQFESMTDELIKKTMVPCQTCLRDAKLSASQIDQVILVGGMTRTPKVVDNVKKFFGKEPFKGVNPDEVVAIGAAIQGAVLAGSLSGIILVDVTPLSLGIDIKGDIFSRIIPKNTPIPARKTNTYVTAEDFQTTLHFTLYQGERERASANKLLGNMTLTGIPPAPKGVAHVDVTFDIDANGIVHATAVDKATGKSANVTVRTSGGLSETEIERMLKEAETSAESDKEFMERVQAKNEADEAIYTAEKFLREPDTKAKISEEDKKELEKLLNDLQRSMSNDLTKADVLKGNADKLKQKLMQIGEALYRGGEGGGSK